MKNSVQESNRHTYSWLKVVVIRGWSLTTGWVYQGCDSDAGGIRTRDGRHVIRFLDFVASSGFFSSFLAPLGLGI